MDPCKRGGGTNHLSIDFTYGCLASSGKSTPILLVAGSLEETDHSHSEDIVIEGEQSLSEKAMDRGKERNRHTLEKNKSTRDNTRLMKQAKR